MNYKQEYENEIKQQNNKGCAISMSGCLYTIILCALTIAAVRGCKIVSMKYKEQKANHEIIMDSINKRKAAIINTTQYRGK